jgi:hypothetical protein
MDQLNTDSEYDNGKGLLLVPIVLILQFMEHLLATCPLHHPIARLSCAEPDCPNDKEESDRFMARHHIGKRRILGHSSLQNLIAGSCSFLKQQPNTNKEIECGGAIGGVGGTLPG